MPGGDAPRWRRGPSRQVAGRSSCTSRPAPRTAPSRASTPPAPSCCSSLPPPLRTPARSLHDAQGSNEKDAGSPMTLTQMELRADPVQPMFRGGTECRCADGLTTYYICRHCWRRPLALTGDAPVASTMASGFSSPPYTVYAPLATPSMEVPSRLGRFCRERARMDGRLRFSGFFPCRADEGCTPSACAPKVYFP